MYCAGEKYLLVLHYSKFTEAAAGGYLAFLLTSSKHEVLLH